MSETEERGICWRCIFLGLLPLLALIGLGWWLAGEYRDAQTARENEINALIEEIADLETTNAALVETTDRLERDLDDARAAVLAASDTSFDDLVARALALPDADRARLMERLGGERRTLDLAGVREAITALSAQEQAQLFAGLPQFPPFRDWFGGLSDAERRAWIAQLPGGEALLAAERFEAPDLSQADSDTSSRRLGVIGGGDAASEALQEEVDGLRTANAALETETDALKAELASVVSERDALAAAGASSTDEARTQMAEALQARDEARAALAALETEAATIELPDLGRVSRAQAIEAYAAAVAERAEAEREVARLQEALAAAETQAAASRAEAAATASRLSVISVPGQGEVPAAEAPAVIAALQADVASANAERDAAKRQAADIAARLTQVQTNAGVSADLQAEIAATRSLLTAAEQELAAAKDIERGLRLRMSESDLEIEQLRDELRSSQTETSEARAVAAERDALVQRLRQGVAQDTGQATDASTSSVRGGVISLSSNFAFGTGSARLNDNGLSAVDRMAGELRRSITAEPTSDWVLLIKGHTDARPISNARFPSNWELSATRAAAVARRLVDQGVPPERLWPLGLAEFAPVDPAETEEAFAKNRRIEFEIVELP